MSFQKIIKFFLILIMIVILALIFYNGFKSNTNDTANGIVIEHSDAKAKLDTENNISVPAVTAAIVAIDIADPADYE